MWRLLRFTFLFVLLTGGAALAQTVSSTTGAIDGKVTDTSSAVLPGVTVTISSAAMMGSRNTVTNPTGDFRFTAITPGDYVATFELPGFVTMRRTEAHVAAGFTASLNIQMNLAGLEEAVTVTGASPVVDTQSTKITTTFDSKTLAALPNGSNDPWAVLAETPVSRRRTRPSTSITIRACSRSSTTRCSAIRCFSKSGPASSATTGPTITTRTRRAMKTSATTWSRARRALAIPTPAAIRCSGRSATTGKGRAP